MIRIFLMIGLAMTFSLPSFAGETAPYSDGKDAMEGYWAPNACINKTPAPLVLIVHQWNGITDHEKSRADRLAEKCYNAFVIDMYGKGIRPADPAEAGKQATMYKTDTALALRRLNAGMKYALSHDGVDPARVAIMGFCFGGTMALELARSGADIKAALSFHGALATPNPVTKPGVIKASILVMHGAEDPLVKHEELHAFMGEMRKADADWELIQYAHAVHAFTQTSAGNDPSKGFAYNANADRRSWETAMNFLAEKFGQ